MPDPIRTNLALPPTLFAEEQVPDGKGESVLADFSRAEGAGVDDVLHMRPGGLLKWDPYGRDPPRRREPPAKDHSKEWSVDSLVDHFREVVLQIEQNMQNHGIPTAEKLDAFVSSLHRNTQRHLKRAPKERRDVLKVLLSRRNLMRPDNRRSTTPEELRTTLNSLIEDLLREFPRGDAAGTGPG